MLGLQRVVCKSLAKQLFGRQLSTLGKVNSHPFVTLKLPKLEEQRSFVFTHKISCVKDLQDVIRAEDPSVQSVNAIGEDGIMFSKCTPISFLLSNGFTLEMLDENLEKHSVWVDAAPMLESDIDGVKDKIKNLAGSLEIVENKIALQDNLRIKLDELHLEFVPLELKRQELQSKSQFRTNVVVWCGLITMSAQFGFLARLVWWDYSWDIMEPVTYFVTYGTAIIMYAYFVCVKSDYNFETARNRWNLRSFHKLARRHGFDAEKYNTLAEQKKEIEDNLRQLENIGALLSIKGDQKLEQTSS